MNNFKNLRELYQALLDGKTIVCSSTNTSIKMINDDDVIVLTGVEQSDVLRLGYQSIHNPTIWSIHQEPEKWYKVIALKKYLERPLFYGNLYKSEEDFLEFNETKKEDYHWILLEEVKL